MSWSTWQFEQSFRFVFGLLLGYLAIFGPIIFWDSFCPAILLELQVCCEEEDETRVFSRGLTNVFVSLFVTVFATVFVTVFVTIFATVFVTVFVSVYVKKRMKAGILPRVYKWALC